MMQVCGHLKQSMYVCKVKKQRWISRNTLVPFLSWFQIGGRVRGIRRSPGSRIRTNMEVRIWVRFQVKGWVRAIEFGGINEFELGFELKSEVKFGVGSVSQTFRRRFGPARNIFKCVAVSRTLRSSESYYDAYSCDQTNSCVEFKFHPPTILFSSFSLCDPPLKVTAKVDEHSSV